MKLFIGLIVIFTAWVVAGQTQLQAPKYNVGVYPSKNFIINSDFEVGLSASTYITDANTISSRSTSSPLEGKASLLIDAATSGHLIKLKTNAIDAMTAGGNCQAIYYVSGDASLYKTAVFLSSTNLTGAYTQLENVSTGSRKVSLFFPCGASGDQPDVEIQATSNSAAAIKVDGVYLGKCIDCTTATTAEFVGSLKYPGKTSCVWSGTSGSFANFSADTDCDTQTVTGSVTAPGTKIPGFVLASVKPGTYRIIAVGDFQKGATSSNNCAFRISDGTNTTGAGVVYNSAANTDVPVLEGSITYTAAQSNVTFQIQQESQGSIACNINANSTSAPTIELNFYVYYYPSSSMQAIRTDCAGNANCENTFSATVGSTGTVSAESIDFINGNCTNGATGDYECTFVTSLFSAAPNCVVQTVDGAAQYKAYAVIKTLSTTTLFYHTGLSHHTVAPVYSENVESKIICNRQSSDRKPSMNVPILVGGVVNGGSGVVKTDIIELYTTAWGTNCTGTPCGTTTASPLTVTRSGTGVYTVVAPSGYYSARFSCTGMFHNGATTLFPMLTNSTQTATAFTFSLYDDAGNARDAFGILTCTGNK